MASKKVPAKKAAAKKAPAKKAPAKKAANPGNAAGGTVRIATFNAENLFARYRFRSNFDPSSADGFTVNNLAFDIYEAAEKQITGAAIKEVNADILALQEIESLPVLDRFHSSFLGGMGYTHRLVIDGNDPRFIDVALLSRHPIIGVRTYRHLRVPGTSSSVFSRDNLEVDLDVNGKKLTLYVNHLKSMMEGRDETHDRRKLQADEVARILDARWGPLGHKGNYIVMGDLNDYPVAQASNGRTSLESLLNHPNLENVVDRLPAAERWTHFFARAGEYHQLDYLLISSDLAQQNAGVKPVLYRKGQPFRATRYTGPRLDNVGEDNPKASDHCPLYMDLMLT